MPPLKRILKHPYKLTKAIRNDFERNVLSRYYGIKPTIINFLANDICNSKCTMCMIWKQKRDRELTPQQLEQILLDPLFSRVKYVGVSGGEPTLRPDLPELYEVICRTLPSLVGTGIITNAIQEKHVIARISSAIDVCKKYNVNFNIMVSLDGVGEFHDMNRGRSGNFDSALKVINHFQNTFDAPVSIGCTITKHNVWAVDELLDFCLEKNIYARFRIAEFITRLYNSGETETIRNFTEKERYNLRLFFFRLEQYESDPTVRRTYENIRNMLSENGVRRTACPYQSKAIVLDSRGQIMYCAPKSKVLGSALESSALSIYRKNLSERRRIRQENCKDCIHDYHAEMTINEFTSAYAPLIWRNVLNVKNGTVFGAV